MIRYALKCTAEDHGFEAWFRSIEDFDRQQARSLVSCPVCGSTNVTKALMAPMLARGSAASAAEAARAESEAEAASQEVAASSGASAPSQMPEPSGDGPRLADVVEALRRIRAEVMANSEDVGTQFADEARRIHYGEAELRSIYGQATLDEAKALMDEGIDLMPLPVLPDDYN